MAKAKEIAGLDCAAEAIDWAGEVLRVRFAEIVELRGAALNSEDIEGVHAMRVATRRLRSALRDFAFLLKKRPLKKAQKDLKRLADALGAARDEDVAILALENLREKAENEAVKNGIGRHIERRRARRETAQLDLMETLSVTAIEDLNARFNAALAEALQKKTKNQPAVSFNEAGSRVVSNSLREFCDLSASLYEPSNNPALHELRIAAKRLRYAVELFTACWGERIAPFAEEIAEMQSFLGEVHDCDVWIEDLGRALRASDDAERQADFWLLSEFVKTRTKNYRAALALWAKWQENDFAERLRATVAPETLQKTSTA
jgi:CHAD domain-containing protein